MKTRFLFVLIALSCSLGSAADLPRSSPEAQGVSSPAVREFIEAADKNIDSFNSFMLVRHGQVVAEGWWSPYDAQSPHSLYSLSKSFTSTAVGLAIAEGKLSLDDDVLKFFPEDVPAEPSNNLKSMRVSDLLRMNTGHQTEPPRKPEEIWTKVFLAHPVPFKPGTHFLYNTSATYMQSAIVQKATGMTVLNYLQPRLFEPLGIDKPTWEASPQGISTGGYGLSVRTEDIAKFGQLYLQRGKWQGKQLVPEAWVEAATARQTSNGSNPKSDWDQGYGYQFWRCRNGAFRGDGAFGQYCIVLPEQDAVIAITSGVKDMQAVMNLIWDKLLPALKPSPLVADESAQKQLQQTLKGLTLKLPTGSGAPAKVSGKMFVFPENDRKLEAISLKSDEKGDTATLVIRAAGVEQRIACGRGAWQKGKVAWGTLTQQPAAASGAWTTDDTFTAKVCFYETPFVVTVRLKFAGDELRFDSETNVGFGSTKQAELIGKAEGTAQATKAKPYEIVDSAEMIKISTPELEATVRKKGYVSGIAAQTFLDKKSGFKDAGYGMDIVDWIMEPGSDEAYRERLPKEMVYEFGNDFHGKGQKRSIEGPQICTQAKELSPTVILGSDFVAVKQSFQYKTAAPGKKTGSTWTQIMVFPAGKRYFVSTHRIDAVNSSDAMFLRLDMPGHIKHKDGDAFSEIYLSYLGRIPSKEFLTNFAPDEKFNYRRDRLEKMGQKLPERMIRAYRLRDPTTGKEGPWLAGMTLDPGAVSEAWCHQRGYVCMIEEFGERPIKAGESFSAAFIVGFFDSIEEMHAVYDAHKGHSGLVVDEKGWKLIR